MDLTSLIQFLCKLLLLILLLTPSVRSQNVWKKVIDWRPCERITLTRSGKLVVATNGLPLIVSTDKGNNWRVLFNRTENIWFYDEDYEGNMFAEAGDNGLFRSSDSGNMWNRVIPGTWYNYTYGLNLLTFLPSGKLLFTTMTDSLGILLSNDHGVTWDRQKKEATPPGSFFILGPEESDTLYGNNLEPRFMSSINEGQTWSAETTPFYDRNHIRTFIGRMTRSKQLTSISPSGVGYIRISPNKEWQYLSRNGVHQYPANSNNYMFDSTGSVYILNAWYSDTSPEIYKYNPFSDTWTTLTYDIYSKITQYMYDLCVTEDGTVFLGADNGLYMLKTQVTEVVGNSNIPKSIDINIFPNPASHELMIHIESSNRCKAKYSIINMLGVAVVRETERTLEEGESTLNVGIGNLPSGTYYFVVHADQKIYRQLFIVL